MIARLIALALALSLQDEAFTASTIHALGEVIKREYIDHDVAERVDARAIAVRRSNAGVRKIEVMAGNIGYLEITNFFRPEEARDAIATAMHTLAHADALIVDMRANGGGSPGTVALLVSYLLDGPDIFLFEQR